MAAGKPNPLFGWPLPCPATLLLLGAGIILFGLGSRAFKKHRVFQPHSAHFVGLETILPF